MFASPRLRHLMPKLRGWHFQVPSVVGQVIFPRGHLNDMSVSDSGNSFFSTDH